MAEKVEIIRRTTVTVTDRMLVYKAMALITTPEKQNKNKIMSFALTCINEIVL